MKLKRLISNIILGATIVTLSLGVSGCSKENTSESTLNKETLIVGMDDAFAPMGFKDENGEIVEIHCTYDPMTKSGSGFNERKPNGNIHYVEATTALPATFNSFEPLLLDEKVSTENFMERLNRNSWHTSEGFVEEYLKDTLPEVKYQFIRNGYYTTDKNSKGDNLIFNLTVGLKSSYNA